MRVSLVPLINEVFDARLANVEGYLDWYYSLPADYERLATLVGGSAEAYAQEQFTAKIGEGVDDSRLTSELARFSEQASALEADLADKLSGYEVSNIPTWLMTEIEPLNTDFLDVSLEPTEKFLEAGERWGISGAVGAGAGIIASKLVNRALAKPFFKTIVSKIVSALGSRAAGSAIGAGVGTIGGPAGIALGVAAGTAAGVGVDYLLLKADEGQNRDTYKQQVIETIEDERAEMLAMVE